MSTWREVQEAMYQRWADAWAATTPYCFEDEGFDPPNGEWVRFSVKSATGQQGSLGRAGNRRFDRGGRLFIQLFRPPGDGVGRLSDLAEQARNVFEGCRFGPHDIRFAAVDIGETVEVDDGRWLGITVEARFEFEEIR